MDLLIVGCGYLGSRIARLAHARGDRVFATCREAAKADALAREGWRPVICDLLRPETLTRLPHVDAVLHAVASDRRAGGSMRDLYVGGMANLLAALPRPGRFVQVSSSSVYGQTDGSVVDETSETRPEEPSGQIVLDAERTLRASFPDAIVLRFSGIYGPGRWLRRASIEAGEPIVADADKWLNLIHVDDGARAALVALDRAAPGATLNVCDDAPVARRDFYRWMAERLRAPAPRFVAPPVDQVPPPHERANRRISNRRLRDLGMTFAYPDCRTGLAATPTE